MSALQEAELRCKASGNTPHLHLIIPSVRASGTHKYLFDVISAVHDPQEHDQDQVSRAIHSRNPMLTQHVSHCTVVEGVTVQHVMRRYADFVVFHRTWSKVYCTLAESHPLPTRPMFLLRSPKVIQKLRERLHVYLQQLTQVASMYPLVLAFVGLDNQHQDAAAAASTPSNGVAAPSLAQNSGSRGSAMIPASAAMSAATGAPGGSSSMNSGISTSGNGDTDSNGASRTKTGLRILGAQLRPEKVRKKGNTDLASRKAEKAKQEFIKKNSAILEMLMPGRSLELAGLSDLSSAQKAGVSPALSPQAPPQYSTGAPLSSIGNQRPPALDNLVLDGPPIQQTRSRPAAAAAPSTLDTSDVVSPQSVPQDDDSQAVATVIAAYQPVPGRMQDCVSLVEGDLVQVLDLESDLEWWYGRVNGRGEGYFPASFVELVDSHISEDSQTQTHAAGNESEMPEAQEPPQSDVRVEAQGASLPPPLPSKPPSAAAVSPLVVSVAPEGEILGRERVKSSLDAARERFLGTNEDGTSRRRQPPPVPRITRSSDVGRTRQPTVTEMHSEAHASLLSRFSPRSMSKSLSRSGTAGFSFVMSATEQDVGGGGGGGGGGDAIGVIHEEEQQDELEPVRSARARPRPPPIPSHKVRNGSGPDNRTNQVSGLTSGPGSMSRPIGGATSSRLPPPRPVGFGRKKPPPLPSSVAQISNQDASESSVLASTNNSSSSSSTDGWYTLAQLQAGVPDVDRASHELLLSPNEFVAVFEVTKEEWNTLPAWKRKQRKKAKGLF